MGIELKGWVIPLTVGVTSFGAGVGAGYLVLQRKFKKKAEAANEEIEELKVQLEFKRDEENHEFNKQIQQVSHVIREFKDEGQEFLSKRVSHEEKPEDRHPSNEKREFILAPVHNKDDDSLVVNIFQDDDDDWDYEEEEQNRGPDHPYIIHRDEFFSNEKDYTQCSLMYYSGDNILCDEHDVPLYNPEKLVGKLEFGRGSRDPNICYIRNEQNQAEYEVLFDPGTFQEEVLGNTPDNLRHSYGVPKFRME